MTEICAKCKKEIDGKFYRINYGKAHQNGSAVTYTDIQTERLYLCDRCTVSATRQNYINGTLALGFMGLCMGFVTVMAIADEGFGNGNWGYVLFTLALLAPLYWTIKGLVSLSPTQLNGESSAVALRFMDLNNQGYTIWTGTGFDNLARSNPQWQMQTLINQMEDLSGKSIVSERDIAAIKEYCRYRAQQWWKTNSEETAICDGCNSPIMNGGGFLIGSYLYCGNCANNQFGSDALSRLRSDPNFFGSGVLEQARKFVSNQKEEPVNKLAHKKPAKIATPKLSNKSQADLWREADIREISTEELEDFDEIDIESWELSGHKNEIQALAFSPDSRLLATSSADMSIRIWNPANGEEIQLLSGHVAGDGWLKQIDGLAFHPNGKVLVSGGAEGLIKIWDPESGKCLRDLQGHESWVKSIAFSPNGDHLASVSCDETVVLWETASWKKIATFTEHKGEIECVTFSPSGTFVATGGLHDNTIHIWNVKKKELHISLNHEDSVYSLAFGGDDSVLASASDDKTTKLWDTNSGDVISVSSEHQWGAKRIVFSPNGDTLVCCGAQPAFKVINLRENTEFVLDENRSGVLACIHPIKSFMILGESDSSSLQIRAVKNGRYIAGLYSDDSHTHVTNISLSPNGEYLAAGYKSGLVQVWDTEKINTKTAEEDFSIEN